MCAKPSQNRAARARDDEMIEEEDLVLHRLDTGPRSVSQQHRDQEKSRSRDADAESKYGMRHDEDSRQRGAQSFDEDEEAFLADARGQPPVPVMDKTGRPEWLQDGIQVARASRRVRLLLALGTMMLLACIFGFVFAGSGSSEDPDGRLQKIYKWAGNVWHSGSAQTSALTSDQSSHLFPIDVGYPGPTTEGKPPNLETEDRYIGEPPRRNSPIETNIPGLQGYNPFSNMGPLTPYRSANDFSIKTSQHKALLSGCQIDRVHILHRHGSRYPTSGGTPNDVREMVRKVQAQGADKHFSGSLGFLNHYDPDRLGLELLVPLGRQQLFESGVLHGMEYGALIAKDVKDHARIFVRSGSQQRIVDSTIAFLQGVWGSTWHDKTDVEVQIEAEGFNTTLAPNFACPNAGKPGTQPGMQWARDWTNTYLEDAVKRIQPHAPGVELTPGLLNGMQQLCSYDTVAFGYSPFCTLFTHEEWQAYEYFWDLGFYGVYGSGSPVGKAQGLGWVNEFMSRLTRTPWDPATQTTENSTFNTHPILFPVDRRFYADFTHDSTIAGVLAALNLPEFEHAMPLDHIDMKRKYRASEIVPFAARLVFEEISCGDSDERVRLLLNEAIVDLAKLKGCSQRADGMCRRSEFIEAMAGRQEWSDWQNCTKPM